MAPAARLRGAFVEDESTAVVGLISTPPTGLPHGGGPLGGPSCYLGLRTRSLIRPLCTIAAAADDVIVRARAGATARLGPIDRSIRDVSSRFDFLYISVTIDS
jgi:hypothetical protein